jgi:hypothetical protein
MPDAQHKKIREILLQLQHVHSAVTVAVAALRQQASDLDVDIANVLQRSAADKILDQIEALEHLLHR